MIGYLEELSPESATIRDTAGKVHITVGAATVLLYRMVKDNEIERAERTKYRARASTIPREASNGDAEHPATERTDATTHE